MLYNCEYEFTKGAKQGKICGRKTVNKFCSKHTKQNGIIKEDGTESIISTVSVQKDEEIDKNLSEISITNQNDNDILITKYFVYDCIKDYFREHKEMNDILSVKKSEGTNMTTIMTMAGVGLLPILLKNLSNINIGNALYKQDNIEPTCNTVGLHESTENGSNYPKQGNAEIIQTSSTSTSTENRENIITSQISNSGIGTTV